MRTVGNTEQSMLAVITALQVLIMVIRIVRPSRGLRP